MLEEHDAFNQKGILPLPVLGVYIALVIVAVMWPILFFCVISFCSLSSSARGSSHKLVG